MLLVTVPVTGTTTEEADMQVAAGKRGDLRVTRKRQPLVRSAVDGQHGQPAAPQQAVTTAQRSPSPYEEEQ